MIAARVVIGTCVVQIVEIVILAMIAAFLGLRLYSVLGQRPEAGADQGETPLPRRVETAEAAPQSAPSLAKAEPRPQAARPHDAAALHLVDPVAERGLRAIMAADRRFELIQFVDGARSAYGMVLDAFWRGDREELSFLCDSDVLAGFNAEIDARETAGETNDSRMIRINDARIVSADYSAPIARITLRFDADIASVTRDKDGTVIAGSLTDALQIHDRWTFSRNLTSSSPDWVLDETDEG